MTDVAKLLAKNLAKYGKPIGVKPCTLIKVTPGTRTGGSLSGGTNPTPASYAASGMIESYSQYQIANSLVTVGDRKISILGGSLPMGIVPAPDDQIAIVDLDGVAKTFTIVKDGVNSDPIGAVHICQSRA